jgi:hypothetical protein
VSLVAFGSAKGSPGLTTVLSALAAQWPGGRPLLVVEADPAGGDLATRLGLGGDIGLMTLAAEGRRELTPELVWQHAQPLPGSSGSHVLAGPASAEQASAALSALSGRLARRLAELDHVDVVADCGRLDPGSPAMALVRAADLVVLVARPSASQLHHLAGRVQALGTAVPVGLLLVGDRPYGVVEAARAVGAEPLGTVADDARAADLLAGGRGGRALRASGLLRTARTVAEALATRLGPLGAGSPAPVTGPEPAPAPPPGPPAPPPAPTWAPSPPAARPSEPSPVPAVVRSDPLAGAGAAAPAGPPTGPPRRSLRARPLQARPRPSEVSRSSAFAPRGRKPAEGPDERR